MHSSCTAPSWADDRGSGHVFSHPPPTASGVARIGSMRCGASPLTLRPSPRCASGTASRCRPLLHPSPGRGPGLTESESALRTSITVSLLSPSSHLRSIRTHHRQLRIPALSPIISPRHQRPSSTTPHHRPYTPAAPHQAGRMTAEAVTYSVNPRQRRGLLATALCVAEHRR